MPGVSAKTRHLFRRGKLHAVIIGYKADFLQRKHLLICRKERRPESLRSDCRKTLGALERAKTLSKFNHAQRHVRWAREDFCGGKSHFPAQKSFPCSFCARKSERFQQKLVGSGRGACSPVHQLVKIFFDKLIFLLPSIFFAK